MSARHLFEVPTEGFVGPSPRKHVRDRLYDVLCAGVEKEAAKTKKQQAPKPESRSSSTSSSETKKS